MHRWKIASTAMLFALVLVAPSGMASGHQAPPANPSSRYVDEGVEITWDAPEGPDPASYRIFRSTVPAQWDLIGETASTSFIDTNTTDPNDPAVLVYRVTAVSAQAEESEPSDPTLPLAYPHCHVIVVGWPWVIIECLIPMPEPLTGPSLLVYGIYREIVDDLPSLP